jgi:hypothetical protein
VRWHIVHGEDRETACFFRGLAVSSILWLILLAGLPASLAAAQPAPSAATPAPPGDGAPVDTAALTLRPSDLAALGLPSYGHANASSLRDPVTDSQLEAGGDPAETAALLQLAQETGFISRHVGSLLQPQVPLARLPSGLIAAEKRVTSAVAEFATAEGASRAFTVLTAPDGNSAVTIVRSGQTFGDESVLRRSRGRDSESGSRLKSLDLVFRRDNLLAGVRIIDYTGNAPTIAMIEALGTRLLENIEQRRGEAAPGLGPRMLRMAPLLALVETGRVHDYYMRIDGRNEAEYADVVAAIHAGQPPVSPVATPELEAGSSQPVATYLFSAPVGVDSGHDPFYVNRLVVYDETAQAAAALRGLGTALGPGYDDVQEVAALQTVPGATMRVYAYSFTQPDHPQGSGYLVVSQIGALLSVLQVDSPLGVSQAGVEALAQKQVACLQVAENCSPILIAEAQKLLADLPVEP